MSNIKPIVLAITIFLPVIAQAQFLDRLRDSNYDRNVSTCWNALVKSGRINSGEIGDYRVRYEHRDNGKMVQFEGAARTGFTIGNCALDKLGNVIFMLPTQKDNSQSACIRSDRGSDYSCEAKDESIAANFDLVTIVAAKPQGNTATYVVRSKNFPAKIFSQSDTNDYAERVGERNCKDSDVIAAYNKGMQSKYMLYGSDGEFIKTFTISKQFCDQRFNKTTSIPTGKHPHTANSESISKKANSQDCLKLTSNEAIAKCASR